MGHTTQLIHFLAITKLELSYDYIQTDWLKIAIISSWNKLTCLLNPLYPRLSRTTGDQKSSPELKAQVS